MNSYSKCCFFQPVLLAIMLLVSLTGVCAETVIETPQGRLMGEVAGPRNEVQVFKGIPYGVPPLGHRRWKPTEPAPSWSGIRQAKGYSPQCLQATHTDIAMRPGSEDCLYLNVWTPAAKGEKLPVMVWIHGGAFRWGSGEIDAVPLARKDVVVVSMNYRLGLFGYLAHPELTAESPHHSSGNYATLDQIQALKWVRDNIAAFGGDPGNVTIFGVSAGSYSVHSLTASPLAKGLFHRAIGQSGTGFLPTRGLFKPLFQAQPAEELGLLFARSAKAKSLGELREISADELLKTADIADNGDFYFKTQGIVDGWIIPDQIYNIYRRGEQHDVPMIMGFNANDGDVIAWLGYAADISKSAAVYEEEIRKRYGNLADAYLSVYPANNYKESYFDAMRDRVFGWAAESWAKFMSNVSSNAYLYYFAHIPPKGHTMMPVPGGGQRKLGASHGAEVAYVFNTDIGSARKDMAMADIVSDYWVAFAKTGVPAVKGRLAWKPYRDQDRHYMKFEAGVAQPGENLLPGMWKLMNEDIARRKTLPGVGRDYYAVGVSSPVLPDS